MRRHCDRCGEVFGAKAANAAYCSGKCRQAAYKARNRVSVTPVVTAITDLGVPAVTTAGQVRAELERSGRLDTYLGAAALQLAERIDSATAVMGFAALVKELRSTMDAALVGAARAPDLVDELEERRERKFGA